MQFCGKWKFFANATRFDPVLRSETTPPLAVSAAGEATTKRELQALARELGFDACRVTPSEPPRHHVQFREWLDEGAAGGMDWMARGADKRCRPDAVLPGSKSVVALAFNYWQGEPPQSKNGRTNGRIARYAWGDDYHELIEKKLDHIDQFLTAKGGTQKCYVDTGPVLERDFAAEAGVGWHGKSTMLLNAELGTWFFLAEVLTTLELPSDQPQPGRCGTCTRCIAACPTGAITSPHRLDARRCISYLTIEHKGSIPLELRPLIGDRIYGCDDCLDACPWNRFAQVSRESSFSARPAVAGMSLTDFLALDDEAFRRLFRKSPIKRLKRKGFLRNVCVALGNVGTGADLPALKIAASDPEPLIAEHAIWAMNQINCRMAGCPAGSN